jgi:hypothetical protein
MAGNGEASGNAPGNAPAKERVRDVIQYVRNVKVGQSISIVSRL